MSQQDFSAFHIHSFLFIHLCCQSFHLLIRSFINLLIYLFIYLFLIHQVLGLLLTIGEAVAYVLSGMYGNISDIGPGNAFLIILQLVFAGVVVLLMDELMQKGYGLGSGISLFIATNICESIVWKVRNSTLFNYSIHIVQLFNSHAGSLPYNDQYGKRH